MPSNPIFKIGDQVETNEYFKEWVSKINKRPGRFYPPYYRGTVIYEKTYPKYQVIQLDTGDVFGNKELHKVA